MTKLLFEVEQSNRLSQEGLLRRFSKSCHGTQETLNNIRINKTHKFIALKNKTKTREYEEWFLKYNPKNKTKQGKFTKKQMIKK